MPCCSSLIISFIFITGFNFLKIYCHKDLFTMGWIPWSIHTIIIMNSFPNIFENLGRYIFSDLFGPDDLTHYCFSMIFNCGMPYYLKFFFRYSQCIYRFSMWILLLWIARTISNYSIFKNTKYINFCLWCLSQIINQF